ncbi:MAG: spermidine synthase [Candidatus Nanopelagicales bacterium]
MSSRRLAQAASPCGELVLLAREPLAGQLVLELRVNGVFVMDTAETSSERLLARSALARVDHPEAVLVGGLGLGFTAAEVLRDARVKRLVVAEIEDALVGWFATGLIPGGAGLLAEPRLEIAVRDVSEVVAGAAPGTYSLILLDVDNGPDALVYPANARLYEREFLLAARGALGRGGLLAIWSAAPCEPLQVRLEEAFAQVTAVPLEVDLQGRSEQFWLYLAGD